MNCWNWTDQILNRCIAVSAKESWNWLITATWKSTICCRPGIRFVKRLESAALRIIKLWTNWFWRESWPLNKAKVSLSARYRAGPLPNQWLPCWFRTPIFWNILLLPKLSMVCWTWSFQRITVWNSPFSVRTVLRRNWQKNSKCHPAAALSSRIPAE